jgi:hypothetical protein
VPAVLSLLTIGSAFIPLSPGPPLRVLSCRYSDSHGHTSRLSLWLGIMVLFNINLGIANIAPRSLRFR